MPKRGCATQATFSSALQLRVGLRRLTLRRRFRYKYIAINGIQNDLLAGHNSAIYMVIQTKQYVFSLGAWAGRVHPAPFRPLFFGSRICLKESRALNVARNLASEASMRGTGRSALRQAQGRLCATGIFQQPCEAKGLSSTTYRQLIFFLDKTLLL